MPNTSTSTPHPAPPIPPLRRLWFCGVSGDQPDGTMSVRTHRRGAMPLSGYELVGTIVIQYSFPSGTQGPQHPNTGRRYHGTTRVAYLPVSGGWCLLWCFFGGVFV